MARLFELHLVHVEEAQSAASVQGRVGDQLGSGGVSGHIETIHEAAIFSGGRLYRLTKLVAPIALRRGEELLVVCRPNKDGSLEVLAFCNRSNGTSFTRPYGWGPLVAWLLFACSLVLIFLVVGLILAPLAFWNAWTMTTRTYPQMQAALEELGRLSGVRDRDELVRRIAAFNEGEFVRLPEPQRDRLFQINLPDRPAG